MLLDILPRLSKRFRIVLASASPRRIDILTIAGIVAEVIPSTFEENLPKEGKTAAEYAICTAREKGLDVFKRLNDLKDGRKVLVISADTVVALDDETILEKPKNPENAEEMLSALSGKSHRTITGLVLIVGRDCNVVDIRECSQTTTVRFGDLTKSLIKAYVANGEPMGKAGAYGIQGIAGTFISDIQGCYYNVMGLPLHKLCSQIRQAYDDHEE